LGKVGARLQVHPTSASSAVGRLERQGFIVRAPHPTDGRTTLVEITAEGRRVLRKATKDLNAIFRDLPLTANQVTQTFALLSTFRRNTGDI
jgi:DNA-binding MarR family transcriptional regulator